MPRALTHCSAPPNQQKLRLSLITGSSHMAAHPAPCWGSLPAELLARIFDAEGPPALL